MWRFEHPNFKSWVFDSAGRNAPWAYQSCWLSLLLNIHCHSSRDISNFGLFSILENKQHKKRWLKRSQQQVMKCGDTANFSNPSPGIDLTFKNLIYVCQKCTFRRFSYQEHEALTLRCDSALTCCTLHNGKLESGSESAQHVPTGNQFSTRTMIHKVPPCKQPPLVSQVCYVWNLENLSFCHQNSAV